MEVTSSQSAAIPQSLHPSRLVCIFLACLVGCLTLTMALLFLLFFLKLWFLLCSGASSGGVSPTRKEQPLFTLRQVGIICERLLKEREEKVREEYEETMTSKLAGWCTVEPLCWQVYRVWDRSCWLLAWFHSLNFKYLFSIFLHKNITEFL